MSNWVISRDPHPAAEARTLSLRVVMAIEEDLLREGWGQGRLVGSQAAIQERFGIGRWAFRETAKVLEMRGSARMRRGPGGGLWSVVPEIDNFARQLTAFITLSRGDEAMVREAIETVAEVRAADADGTIVAFLTDLFERVLEMFAPEGEQPSGPDFHRLVQAASAQGSLNGLCYSRQVAVRIMDDIIRSTHAHPRCIGSEWDLTARYDCSLQIIRQASRILEGMEIVEIQMGRNGGIYTRTPRLTLSRAQLFSYLSARGVDPDQACACADALRTTLAGQAASGSKPIFDALLPAIDDYVRWASIRAAA